MTKAITDIAIYAALGLIALIVLGMISATGAGAHPKETSHCHPGSDRLTRCH